MYNFLIYESGFTMIELVFGVVNLGLTVNQVVNLARD